MIASVVATLETECSKKELLQAIATLPIIEIGDAEANPHRVPLVIDTTSASDLETATEQLRQCPGVAFVDVVFVHFEDSGADSYDSIKVGGDQA